MNKRLAQFSLMFWRRTAFWRSGAGLTILVLALGGLRWWWIQSQCPAYLAENAAAYGSLRTFYGPAQINHDGSKFIYVATADDRGRALFLDDTATGTKRQIIDDTQGVRAWNDDYDIQAGPWSPDDKCFVCLVSNRLMVCSSDTNGEKVIIEDKPFSEAAWLTPAEFAYVADGTNLCVAQKRGDGQWEHKIFLSEDVPLTSLTAIDSKTVAWLENGALLCRADLSEGGSGAGIQPAYPTNQVSGRMPDTTTPPTNGLALWLDASRLRQPDQAPVRDLPDLSRNANNAMGNRTPPVFNATTSARALNGKGTIHFGVAGSSANSIRHQWSRYTSGLVT